MTCVYTLSVNDDSVMPFPAGKCLAQIILSKSMCITHLPS